MFQLKGPLLSLALQPSLHDQRASEYLQSISFIASVGFALAVAAAISLGTASSVFGVQLENGKGRLSTTSVQTSTECFVAAATAYGLALVSSIASQAAQALTTDTPGVSPSRNARHDKPGFIFYTCVFIVVWAPPMLIVMATMFVGSGMMLFDNVLGYILHAGILIFLFMTFISQRAGTLAIALMATCTTVPTLLSLTFGPLWFMFVIAFSLLLLVASISAICQLKLSHELQQRALSSSNPQPLSAAYPHNDMEQSAGLVVTPATDREHQHTDLGAITTQLSLLVHAVERLAAQNASPPPPPDSAPIPAADQPAHLRPRPDNPVPHVSTNGEQNPLPRPVSPAHRYPPR